MRRWAAALALVALAVGSTACSGSSSPKAGTTTTSTTAPPPPTWTGVGGAPASRLVTAGGHVVYLAHANGAFALVALDPTTGAVAWRVDAAAGGGSDRPAVLTDGDRVIGFETPQVVRAVDGRTGAVQWRTQLPGVATSQLAQCGDDICVATGADATGTPSASLVTLDADDGRVRSTGAFVGAPVIAIGSNTVLSVVGPQLVLASDGATKTVWQVALGAAFPSLLDVATTTWRAWPGPDGAWVVFAGTGLAGGTVIGIARDGGIAWRLAGAHPCAFLEGDVAARAGDPSLPVVLCVGDATRTVIAVDPVTGAAAWTLDADVDSTTRVVRVSPRSWLIDNGLLVDVDVKEGPRSVGLDLVDGWCGAPDPTPCDFDGRRLSEPRVVPDYSGVTIAGWGVWIDGGSVDAIKLP